MKKIFILATAILLLATFSVNAQEEFEFGFLRHYSLSLGIGTTGITGDLGTMIGKHAGLRLGVDYMPNITYSTKLNTKIPNEIRSKYNGLPEKVEANGKYENNCAHALIDIYPFNNSGFHVTVGAYFAKQDKIITVYSEDRLALQEVWDFNNRLGKYEVIPESYGQIGIKVGNDVIMPDKNCNIGADINVQKVRPYAGIGFGRAVPGVSRLKCQFDLGVQFWKKPDVYNRVTHLPLNNQEENSDVIETISKIKAFPVLSVRLSGRLF